MPLGSRLDPDGRQPLDALHELLLRLGARLPDDLVAQARQWLADAMPVEAAQAVVFGAVAGRVPITDADATMLTRVLNEAGEESDAVAEVPRGTVAPHPHYRLAPVSPAVLAAHGAAIPYRPDLTGGYDGPGGPDGVDRALTRAVDTEVVGVRALWRVWRFPDRETRWPPPRRMYLVQVVDDEVPHPVGVAAAVQAVLRAQGEQAPRVEVFTGPESLPDYQRTALASAALLWTAAPPRPIRFAHHVLAPDTDADGTDPEPDSDGPDPVPVRLDADERARTCDYLDAGVPLVISARREVDPLDPDRGAVVPTNVRTDGSWIWTDALSHHLREHGLPPEPDLLTHIRARAYAPPEVDPASLHRALAVLGAFVAIRPT